MVTINGGSGSGATATAVLTNGMVTGFTITNPGSGYTTANPPTITIAPPILTATAAATLSGNTVSAITVASNGARLFEPAGGHADRRRLHHSRDGDRRVDQWHGHRDQRHRRLGLHLGADGVDRPPGQDGALAVNYTSPNTTGTLTYSLLPFASGTSTITVTVSDNGSTANGGIVTFSRTFIVTVTPANQAPTLNPITVNPTVLENTTALQTVNLSGIGVGPGNTGQTLSVKATSSNTALINTPTINYTANNPTGVLTFTPQPFVSGSAVITVTVTENGGTVTGGTTTVSQSFTVTVTPVNQPPTLNPILNPAAIAENAGTQMVNLSGIGVGPGNTGQTLNVSATSNNTALISTVGVNYAPNNPTGQLVFTPVAGASGTALITVLVTNNGNTANGGVNFVTQSFTVTVNAVNQGRPWARSSTRPIPAWPRRRSTAEA